MDEKVSRVCIEVLALIVFIASRAAYYAVVAAAGWWLLFVGICSIPMATVAVCVWFFVKLVLAIREQKPALDGWTELSKASAAFDLERKDALDWSCEEEEEEEDLFPEVDREQHQHDREAALRALAAAAASRGAKPTMSADEKAAPLAKGRADREAAAAKLATQLKETDAELWAMDDDGRDQWFADHADELPTDAPDSEKPSEKQWSGRPDDTLVMAEV